MEVLMRNSEKVKSSVSRRRFLLLTIIGGVSSVACNSLAQTISSSEKEKKILTKEMKLVKNPAFSLKIQKKKPVLQATTGKGKTIGFSMDEAGVFLWKKIPCAEESQKGAEMTVKKLLDLAEKKYGKGKSASVRKEAYAFLKQAYESSVVVDSETKIFVAYKPAEK